MILLIKQRQNTEIKLNLIEVGGDGGKVVNIFR